LKQIVFQLPVKVQKPLTAENIIRHIVPLSGTDNGDGPKFSDGRVDYQAGQIAIVDVTKCPQDGAAKTTVGRAPSSSGHEM
jgi:uncharacterized protein YheU (UPF0270 family)